MKSFRLDRDSVTWFLGSWPSLLVGGLLAGALVYVGMNHPWGRVAGVIWCGLWMGFMLRGIASARLRDRYPNARWHGLLSVGMATFTIGMVTRMALPEVQGRGFDLAWLGVAFFSILAFVVANRQDEDVVR